MATNDEDVIGRIEALAHEEHELFERGSHGDVSDRERLRLAEIQLQLDQCYELLRQRRARRSAGLDPERAKPRPASVVEGYAG